MRGEHTQPLHLDECARKDDEFRGTRRAKVNVAGRRDVQVGLSGAWRRGQRAEKMTRAMRELRMRPFYALKLSIRRGRGR
jgi:hypothetical protein